MLRLKQIGDIPCMLCGDVNVNPNDSKILSNSVRARWPYDIFYNDINNVPPPTYHKGGIAADMAGKGTSRIDVVYPNPAAVHGCKTGHYVHRGCAALEHVPLHVHMHTPCFKDMMRVACFLAQLRLRSLAGVSNIDRDRILRNGSEQFKQIWLLHDQSFCEAIQRRDLERAHAVWCLACEYFSCYLQRSDKELPAGNPRRG